MAEDPAREEWRPSTLAPGNEVSSLGRVKNFKGKLLSPWIDGQGYLRASLTLRPGGRKHFLVHRLVAAAFLPAPAVEDPPIDEVHHKDHDRANNTVANLQWVTGTENRRQKRPQKASSFKGRTIMEKLEDGSTRLHASVRAAAIAAGVPYRTMGCRLKSNAPSATFVYVENATAAPAVEKETWRSVDDLDDLDLPAERLRSKGLEISSLGRVKNKHGKITQGGRKGNYLYYSRCSVHRLVAFAFCDRGKSCDDTVNHKNGNTCDNRAANLEWTSSGGNSRHAVQAGLTRQYPVRAFHSDGTTSDYRSQSEAARALGVDPTSVSDSIKRKRKRGGYHFTRLPREEQEDAGTREAKRRLVTFPSVDMPAEGRRVNEI